jgi:hypothetical protein
MQHIEKQKICFEYLESGDKCLDALFFIKMMFEIQMITPAQKQLVLNYLLSESMISDREVETSNKRRSYELPKP